MVTCKHFLQELTDFLDQTIEPGLREELEKHVRECPNCWVLCNTTEKTLKVFKGMQVQEVPPAVQARLMHALELKMQSKMPGGAKKADA